MTNTDTYQVYPLFEDVQMSRIFPDAKTFVDCLPRFPVESIIAEYDKIKSQPGFNLERFVLDHFELPAPHSTSYHSDAGKTVEENIEALWDVLTRQPDKQGGTLIPLPHPYVVPGGRFDEIYYWDSYFTMLGLKESGRYEMVENMVNNFSYLIDLLGYIPNGNRSYFIGRSQPPFYSLMVHLLATIRGPQVLLDYLPELEKEYRFWMKGAAELSDSRPASRRTVRMPGGEVLNRYWDENDTPRPESYNHDVELALLTEQRPDILYRNLRAGAESGWDYSCRWFKYAHSFASIHTTDIIPVDLNCLLWHLEKKLEEAYQAKGEQPTAAIYQSWAEKRKEAIDLYCWDAQQHFYVDYDWTAHRKKTIVTLAGLTPLTFKLTTQEKANDIAVMVREKFLQPGGVVSTPETSGQQWDAPNGWAPLQWMTITGLENYGHHELAGVIARRWIQLNNDVFKRTGKLMEKYNVIDTHLEAGGGEYAGQDGFGWTNGVLLALIKKYGRPV